LSNDAYLGVLPSNGFLVDLNTINPVMVENMAQTIMNLVHPNFRQNPTGINHIPTNVAR